MTQYHHRHNLHNEKRYVRRSRRIFLMFVAVVMLAVGILIYDFISNARRGASSTKPSQETRATYIPYNQTFETPYYRFETGRNWQFVQAKSAARQFYYRYMENDIIEHEMTITIGGQPSPEVSRVLPVTRGAEGRLIPQRVSDLCNKFLPPNAAKITQPVTIAGVRMTCNYDGLDYSVIVGVSGEQLPLVLRRPDGSSVAITIVYHNLNGQPDDTEIRRIVESLQAR